MAPDRKYYAVMHDRWGDMTIVYDDIVKAYQRVVNDLDIHPDGCIRVIENGICIREIEQKDFDLLYNCAATIVKAECWSDVVDEMAIVCWMVGLEDEWNNAIGNSFLDVLRKAGSRIGVDLLKICF